MVEPAVRYARTRDGVSIAYQVCGTGPPLVVAAGCPFSHVQEEWRVPALRSWHEAVARQAQLIRYDGRGTGLSDRAATDFSLAAQLADLTAVIEHLGLEQVTLVGAGPGSPVALAYAATFPARLSHLLLWTAYARGADLPAAIHSLGRLVSEDWTLYTEVAARAIYGWQPDEPARQHAAFLRTCVTPEALAANDAALQAVDASWALPRITTPTLVMTRRDAPQLGVDAARALASRIANAQLCILDGASLAPFMGDSTAVLDAMTAFLTAATPPAPPAAPPRTPGAALTAREREVLRLLAHGRSGREIAGALTISLATVQRHIANIYTKAGVAGRVEAAAYAYRQGLVDPAQE